ncbi:MAG TPA: hypothetical protein VL283_04595 [Candidatus Baltobacteraceae bacterium]|nr:hypothetical protein [Candidatus Baltobacteraceae bacterium]
MDQRKIAILSTVAILVIGGAVLGLVAWRYSQLAPPAVEQPGDGTVPPEDGGTLPEGGGTTVPPEGTTPDGNGAAPESPTSTGQTPLQPDTATTIDPAAVATGCDTSVDDFDCDYDNLSNKEERERKTDPLKADTDGDGLSDASEIYVWKSDPLNPRSIDPTMTDLEAVNAGKRDTR